MVRRAQFAFDNDHDAAALDVRDSLADADDPVCESVLPDLTKERRARPNRPARGRTRKSPGRTRPSSGDTSASEEAA